MSALMGDGVVVRIAGEPICPASSATGGSGAPALKGFNTFIRPATAAAAFAPVNPPPGAAAAHSAAAAAAAAPGADGPSLIVAATCGAVEVVGHVVSVRGVAPRYAAETGDVIVGRITDVLSNRWLVDVGAPQLAHMPLSNVTEPGGMLRRRGREDELSMRRIFSEGDLVAAEVQRVSPDGLITLHTRCAAKYGKVTAGGSLVRANPSRIRRLRRHFHVFRHGVTGVLGANGWVWLAATTHESLEAIGEATKGGAESTAIDRADQLAAEERRADESAAGDAPVGGPESTIISTDAGRRHAVARARNVVTVLDQQGLSVEPVTIEAAFRATEGKQIATAEVLWGSSATIIADAARAAKSVADGRVVRAAPAPGTRPPATGAAAASELPVAGGEAKLGAADAADGAAVSRKRERDE